MMLRNCPYRLSDAAESESSPSGGGPRLTPQRARLGSSRVVLGLPILKSQFLVLGVLFMLVCPACRLPSFNPLGVQLPQETARKAPRSSPRPSVSSGATESGPASDAVLEVAGTVITSEEVLGPLSDALLATRSEAAGGVVTNDVRRAIHDAVRRRVEEVLLYQEALGDMADGELEYLERYVDQIVRETVQEEHDGRQRAYERELSSKGTTLDEQRDRIRHELVVQRYLSRELRSRIVDPTRRELMQYFEQAKADLSKPERREMFLIDVPIEAAVTGEGEDELADSARSRIEGAERELADGASFSTVAAGYSKGIHAADGGAWGWVSRTGLRPRWHSALESLYSLEEGEVSSVRITDEAYFIVRCGRIEEATEPDFQAIQPELQERYRRVQQRMYLDELMTRLLDDAELDSKRVEQFVATVARQAVRADNTP